MGAPQENKKKLKSERQFKFPVCIGFDPDTSELHAFLEKQFRSTPLESFLVRWYQATIAKISEPGISLKLQAAFFEQFGPAGMTALRDIIIDAKRRGLYVILDAKRGDISSTMTAYGHMAFDTYHADALTILPWMGTDSLKALLPWLKKGKRVYIVWLSSNKSGRDLQLQPAPKKTSPIAMVMYEQFSRLARKEKVLDQVGWVLGATDLPDKILSKLPKRPHCFLLPGVGAQGAEFDAQTAALLRKHPDSLFPISRALTRPETSDRIENWEQYSGMVKNRWDFFINECLGTKTK